MLKYALILIHSLVFFLYGVFSGEEGITIKTNIPAVVKPGARVPVEIRINKGSTGGFAKMQLELPVGISVDEVDSDGSNFSYVEGTAKWVWASLPPESEIVLKLYLVVEANATGKSDVTGKYSFVENNAKQVVEMTPVEVTIEGTAADAAKSEVNETKTETPAATDVNTVATTSPERGSNKEPDGNIQLSRTIVKQGAEYTITVKINKGSTKGFARFSDDLADGITAKSVKTDEASFSVSDGKVKFVWVNVPEKDELELVYTLSGIKNETTLNGEYSYLEDNQSKKAFLTPEKIAPEAGSETVTTGNTDKTEVKETNNTEVKEENANTNVVKEENKESVKENTNTKKVEDKEKLVKNETGVQYRVQIGAFTNSEVKSSKLSNKFSIREKISSEFEGGFSKFMVGSHNEYMQARDHREKIRNNNGISRAFVVAYNTGRRITVQEALMITSQKWFK